MGNLGTVELRTDVYFSKSLIDKVPLDCSSLYFLKIKVTLKLSANGGRGCNIMLRYGYVIKNQGTKICFTKTELRELWMSLHMNMYNKIQNKINESYLRNS